MKQHIDVIIIGGGPAGLTAGIYTARARLNTLLLEKEFIGGQIVNAELVENFPGFAEGIDGYELTQLMYKQAVKFGLETATAEVTGLEPFKDKIVLKTNEAEYIAKVVIIAGGSKRKMLEVPGEIEFTGRGVSYCATCDAAFFRDQTVAVNGGGDASITEALHLSRFASKVIVIHRRDQLRATRILQETAFSTPNIEFLWDTTIERIDGENQVKQLLLNNVKTGEKSTLEVNGIFVAIGFKPDTDFLKGILDLDDIGHIITNENMETKIPGIFAAGDIRHNSGRQAITAAGDGATAAIYAEKYLI